MSSKLVLWLTLTLLVLQVASCKKSKETIVLKKQLIKDPDESPIVSPFQKNYWFHCWVVRKKFDFSVEVTKIILSYLMFAPTTTSLCPHYSGLGPVVLSRNGRWLLSSPGKGPDLYLSDLATGQRLQTFTCPSQNDDLWSYAIADSRLFVAAGGWKNIYVWNTNSAKLVATLTGHTWLVSSCIIFCNDTRIVSSSYDETLRIWNVEQNQCSCLYVLQGHQVNWREWIGACVVSPDNAWIMAMSLNGILQVWKSDTGEYMRTLTHARPISACVFSVDNRYAGSMLEDGETKVWDVSTGENVKTIARFSFGTAGKNKICYLSGERLVWWNKAHVGVWDLTTDRVIYDWPFTKIVGFATVSPDNKYIIIALAFDETDIWEQPQIRVYSMETGELIE